MVAANWTETAQSAQASQANQGLTQGRADFFSLLGSAVYGNPEYFPIDEKHPLRPENYYGYTKLTIEQNLEWYSRLRGLKYAALRYFNATGYDIDGMQRAENKTQRI